jgi:manganese transport protein
MAYTILIVILIFIIIIQFGVIIRLRRQKQRVVLGLDELSEDVLKALYHLTREQAQVRKNDLVRATEIQSQRLPMVLIELERRGWARLQEGVILMLPAGERRALELIRAHRLWERYLAEKEGFALNALHAEAMRREHKTSAEEADRLEVELGFPRVDPHGDPIPARGEILAQHAEGTPLSRWQEHRPGRVTHVEDEPPELLTQILLLGLTPGAQVEVDERKPGRVLVWSGRQRLALAPAVAERVFVVDAPAESTPLSELELGQAGTVLSLSDTLVLDEQWGKAGLLPGAEIAYIRADPLGDPVTYRVNGNEIILTRGQANQIALDALSVHEIPLLRRHWLVEEYRHFKELLTKYGSWTVLKRALLFLGPAFVISVGYMDPGNWGTDIEGGARFGYKLLWIILLANLMAILLQVLSAKLGIATGKSLPQVCRDHYPRWLSVVLWITAELAAIATDLAEFLGGAVGFYLLFRIPLFPAALLTGVVISLILLLEHFGMRKLEMVIIGLIAVIGFVYMSEIWLSKPNWGEITRGLLLPSIPVGATLVAVGIIGATVMPHNLYLHSALIQTRVRSSDSLDRKKQVYRLAILDTAVALNGAFFVNAAILAMSAAVFSGGKLHTYSLESAHQTLTPLLGPLAGIAFAVALLASGLASSTTATLAGQVVMEGFLHHRINVWLRRLITMLPSLIIIWLGVDPLQILVLSQVSLSFQLPFAVVPLVLFTSDHKVMGEFTNNRVTILLAWLSTLLIFSLNFVLLYQTLFK